MKTCPTMRVHQIAAATDMTSKEVRAKLERLGIKTKSASSSIERVAAESFIALNQPVVS